MIRGWFVGSFVPTSYSTKDCEVAFKEYKAGDSEDKHYHKVATEITMVVSGEVSMNGKFFTKGEIIVVNPGETVEFKAITDASNIVVKVPCIKGDKYVVK
jgi:uncharacterized cupin superfamily protein